MIFVCRHAKSLQSVQLFATSWTVTYQALLSMGFPRKEYWSWLPCPALGDLPDQGIEPMSLALQEDSFPTKPLGKLSKYLSLFR